MHQPGEVTGQPVVIVRQKRKGTQVKRADRKEAKEGEMAVKNEVPRINCDGQFAVKPGVKIQAADCPSTPFPEKIG